MIFVLMGETTKIAKLIERRTRTGVRRQKEREVNKHRNLLGRIFVDSLKDLRTYGFFLCEMYENLHSQ